MSSDSILYITNTMLSNEVIMTDLNGKNEVSSLKQLKYNQIAHNKGTNKLNKDSFIINEKTYYNCVIRVDIHGNNTILSKDTNMKENNIFTEVLKQVLINKKPANIDEVLFRKRELIQNKLQIATDNFNSKFYNKACDLYSEVLTIIEKDIYPDEFMLKDTDLIAIKFAYALSKMAIRNYKDIKSAQEILISLTTNYGDDYPTLHYYLARTYFLLDEYQIAIDILENAQNKLKNVTFLNELDWPGSKTKMMKKAEKPLLEKNIRSLLNECNVLRLPDTKCIYFSCPNKNIFFDSLCFNGYINVKCSEKCIFSYHRHCWKMKLKAECIKKASNFLGTLCVTEDCNGIICEIVIYDEILHVNTSIKSKLTNSSGDHKKKDNISNGKNTKKKILNQKSKNEKFIVDSNVDNNAESSIYFNDNKSNISNKNEKKTNLEKKEDKKEKEVKLNLNAKEYIPVNSSTIQKEFRLNNSAKEYTPSVVSESKIDNRGQRLNLFDIEPSSKMSQETNKFLNMCGQSNAEYNNSISNNEIYMKNVSVVNYSEVDAVSADFVCDEDLMSKKSANMAVQDEPISFQSLSNENVPHGTNNTYPNDIVDDLKNEVYILRIQLFEAEEAYNNLLTKYNLVQTKLQDTFAKPQSCEKCAEMLQLITKKDNNYSNLLSHVKQSEEKNDKLILELNELKAEMHLELQTKQSRIDFEQNFIKENQILKRNVEDLISRLKIMSQQNYMPQQAHIRKVMFDQIDCIRHAYASYFTMYENKSKHMLWELEDIRSLSTDETLPSKAEVVENIKAWKKTLDDSIKFHHMMNDFYRQLCMQFSNEPNNSCPVPMSFPTFIIEPPNIILRHFKPLLVVNKKLEKELVQQMNTFYKMISTPYAGQFPPKEAEIHNFLENATNRNPTIISDLQKKHLQTIHDYKNNDNDPLENLNDIPNANVLDLVDGDNYSDNISSKILSCKLNNFNCNSNPIVNQELNFNTNSVMPNIYDKLLPNTSFVKVDSKHLLLKENTLTEEVRSKKENFPVINTEEIDKYASASGTIPKTKTSKVPGSSISNTSIQIQPKPKRDVIGQESLVITLHKKLPLVPAELITKAVHILREKYGGLTGKDSKQIITEIKEVLKKITVTEKSIRKSKESATNNAAWKTVDNEVWNNDNPDVNCTICFEFMAPDKRMILRCQHIFHTFCIKLWLQNDSICPICRSFTTLDEEFPPLR